MHLKKTPRIRRILETTKYKLAWIYGGAGMEIPAHQVKDESVLLVQQGNAILIFKNQVVELKKNDCRVIPANAMHSLKLSGDFEGLTIMSADARLEFPLTDILF
ncbi:MAG: hypothetical protein ABUT20_04550 [Bacteroidota bacterium]